MAQRRFGPTNAAGVVVIEKPSSATISPAALGIIGYMGVAQRGPVGELGELFSKNDFAVQYGPRVVESLVPDASFDFWDLGKGAGRQYMVRVTDGSEVASELILKSRKDPRTEVIKVKGKNGGRWAGKKQTKVGDYVGVTQITLDTGLTMLEDEFVGALVTLEAVPGKSFKVESNDIAGVLSFASDTKLLDDIGAAVETLFKISLANDGLQLGVLVKDGLNKPTTEFGLEIYDSGVLVKEYTDLSHDPDAANYFVDVVNDDTSNFWVELEDLHVGAILADVRPSNYFGAIDTVTTTKLTARIFEHVTNSVAGAIARLDSPTYGAGIIKGKLTLAVTTAGSRADGTFTQSGQPADGETIEIAGAIFTFRTAPTLPDSEILIGGTAEASLDNALAFINAKSLQPGHALYTKVFAEKDSATVLHIYAMTAGLAGNAFTLVAPFVNWTASAATLTTGVDQIWSVTHDQLGLLTGTLTSGIAYVKENDFLLGFTLIDMSRDSTKVFAIADSLTVDVDPLEPNSLINQFITPDTDFRRIVAQIESNTAFEITVKVGNDLTALTDTTKKFLLTFQQELGGGYDGLAGLADSDFTALLDPGSSPFNELFGKNVGLVKMASPGTTSTLVQKAGASYAEGRNYQWRYELPSNIVTESAAEQHLNDTLGRNDFAVMTLPSFAYVDDPDRDALKLVPTVGMIHGREALIAKNFDGYHKAGSDLTATIPGIVKLTTGNRVLNEEFLNPQGIGIIKKIKGNFTIWGDRNVGNDSAFKFKHKREYMSHQENILRENFDFIIFGINSSRSSDVELARTAINAHFLLEFNKGALEGDSFSDAFSLKIDGENNTTLTRSQGDLNAELKFRIVDTIERFIITVSQLGIFESVE